jgi:hypothetical protein
MNTVAILAALLLFVSQAGAPSRGQQQQALTPLSAYEGRWTNIDPNTRGYPAVKIVLKAGKPMLEITPLPSKEMEGVVYTDNVGRSPSQHTNAIALPGNRLSFILKLEASGKKLRMESYTTFTDSRSSTFLVDEFRKVE